MESYVQGTPRKALIIPFMERFNALTHICAICAPSQLSVA